MGFDASDIRRGMDVYTRDNVYLGSVLDVRPAATDRERRTPQERANSDAADQSRAQNGELFGPMPTAPLGNSGPSVQSAARAYASSPDSARPLGRGTLTVGRWLGPIGRRTVSLDEVQTVSLERVVLR